jgi:hypothetical protein
MPDDKKKQAMSLLFGDAPPKPRPAPARKPDPEPPADDPESEAAAEAGTATAEPARPAKAPGRGRGGGRAPATSAPEPAPSPDPYYQGNSRYRRASGEQVKHSVYLDPDVSQAVKVAAALGDDPRGSNVSAIVNEALRELGYGSD